MGVIGGIYGYLSLVRCLTLDDGKEKLGFIVNECAVHGKLEDFFYMLEIGGFVLQILLVWFSYILIPCSKKKGMPKFRFQSKHAEKLHDDAMKQSCCGGKRGGRLKCFMIYELVITLLTVILCIVMIFPLKQDDSTSIRAAVYFTKVIYGLLSFPFVLFAIPVVSNLLTRTKSTKYNK